VGEIFHQVGHDMARRSAEEQFRSKAVVTVATLPEHMESFSDLWFGLQRRWLAALAPAERTCFDNLHTDNLRDAFRIVRSYWRRAVGSSETDFGVAAADLGSRLGVSLQAACQIRRALANSGVIEQTAPYQPNRRATRYRWICDNDSPGQFRSGHRERETMIRMQPNGGVA
jgi:ribosomal protein S25